MANHFILTDATISHHFKVL
ncbi:hypothetical protein [Anaerocolumna sp. AGMB13020]